MDSIYTQPIRNLQSIAHRLVLLQPTLVHSPLLYHCLVFIGFKSKPSNCRSWMVRVIFEIFTSFKNSESARLQSCLRFHRLCRTWKKENIINSYS